MTFKVPEMYRIRSGKMGSSPLDGNNGAFRVPMVKGGNITVNVIASDEGGWEHVSVSLSNRCPTWEEMCRIKALFWDVEDCVVQYHPPVTEYVNNHPYCLHLWRPVGVEIPAPPRWMVGHVT